VISESSVRDRFRSFLSPASLEPAEDAEEDRWSEFLIGPKIQTNTSPLRGDESFSVSKPLSVISESSVRDNSMSRAEWKTVASNNLRG